MRALGRRCPLTYATTALQELFHTGLEPQTATRVPHVLRARGPAPALAHAQIALLALTQITIMPRAVPHARTVLAVRGPPQLDLIRLVRASNAKLVRSRVQPAPARIAPVFRVLQARCLAQVRFIATAALLGRGQQPV